jgi:hypothetical protein
MSIRAEIDATHDNDGRSAARRGAAARYDRCVSSPHGTLWSDGLHRRRGIGASQRESSPQSDRTNCDMGKTRRVAQSLSLPLPSRDTATLLDASGYLSLGIEHDLLLALNLFWPSPEPPIPPLDRSVPG